MWIAVSLAFLLIYLQARSPQAMTVASGVVDKLSYRFMEPKAQWNDQTHGYEVMYKQPPQSQYPRSVAELYESPEDTLEILRRFNLN